jgi:ubiquitin-protein ligase
MSEVSVAVKRIHKDRVQIEQEPDYAQAFCVAPFKKSNFTKDGEITEEDDLFHWGGYIYGLEDTPYQGGKFKIDIRFTTKYPIDPPTIVFLSKIFHPNISDNGIPCLSILRRKPDGEWSASWTLGKTLLAVRSLLAKPNPDDPLNSVAAKLYKTDIDEFNSRAMMTTLAGGTPETPH